MYPVLFRFPEIVPLLGGRGVHFYGVMVALGFLAGLFWVQRESKRFGISEEKISDLFFLILVSGILGARILFFINSDSQFWHHPLAFFKLWEGGLVFQGGVVLALFVTIWFCRKHNLQFFQIADIFSPALSLGHAFGRIGCFLAGCCYGKACAIREFYCVIFPDGLDAIAPAGIPLYPTQLMESLGELIIFSILVTYRRRKKFEGSVFLLYIMLYAVLRSVVELFRGDLIRGFVIEPYLSVAQLISLLTFILAAFVWRLLASKFRKSE